MGTKNNPGKYDCYANAEPDEPLFVLLARDVTAQYFVAAWVAVQCGDMSTAWKMMRMARNELDDAGKKQKKRTDAKMVEADQCSYAMRTWLHSKQLDAAIEAARGATK